jgi:hypothetical protein
MARKSPIQMHHIRYGNEFMPEWTVALKMWMHKAVTLLARLNATEEHYVLAVNFLMSIQQVVNDMRMALDTGTDTHASQKKHFGG